MSHNDSGCGAGASKVGCSGSKDPLRLHHCLYPRLNRCWDFRDERPLGNAPSYGDARLAGCVASGSSVPLGTWDSSPVPSLRRTGRVDLKPGSSFPAVSDSRSGKELLWAPMALGMGAQAAVAPRLCLQEAALFFLLLRFFWQSLSPAVARAVPGQLTVSSPEVAPEPGRSLLL